MKKRHLFFSFKIICIIMIYGISISWLIIHVSGKGGSSFQKYLHEYMEQPVEVTDKIDIKFFMNSNYRTFDDYAVYEINGWQVEKRDGGWRNTVTGILLESKEKRYLINVLDENLEHASRIAGATLESDKIAYHTFVPTIYLKAGRYRIGILLEGNRVLWSDEWLSAPVYYSISEGNSILLCDPKLIHDPDTKRFTGVGTEIYSSILGSEESEEVRISFQAKAGFENTYLVIVVNAITKRIDLSEQYERYELSFPINEGVNDIWTYCIVDGDVQPEEGKEYYWIRNGKMEFR